MASPDPATRAYYEAEAEQRLRKPLRGLRVDLREEFVAQLRREGRTSVVDFGAGPGGDVVGFVAEGLVAVGIDVAVGNARLAAEAGVAVVPSDVTQPPLRHRTFEAGWSMSTMMHLDDDLAASAVAALARTTVAGAPIRIGVWGGTGSVRIDDSIPGKRRVFHGRTLEQNTELFTHAAVVEAATVLDIGPNGYQLFDLRST